MDEITKKFIELIKIMDELGTGEMSVSVDFQNGTKRSVKVIVDDPEED
jgi:hypothetical protein